VYDGQPSLDDSLRLDSGQWSSLATSDSIGHPASCLEERVLSGRHVGMEEHMLPLAGAVAASPLAHCHGVSDVGSGPLFADAASGGRLSEIEKSEWSMACHPESSFKTPEEARVAANSFALPHGYALVHKSTLFDKKKRRRRIVLGCDRHGSRREYISTTRKKRPNAATRKCGCSMELNIVRIGEPETSSERWKLEHRTRSIVHNHPPSSNPSAHPVHRRASRTMLVRTTIATDANTGTRVAQTASRLRLEHPDVLFVDHDIYNERQRAVTSQLDGMSRMEFLLKELEEGDYTFAVTTDDRSRITNLFFAYGPAVEIYKDNFDVLLLDCTYKTNKFNMPLLNVVGISGNNKTIHVAQVFLRTEKKENYEWALAQIHKMMQDNNIDPPQVFFTDREEALLNALEQVFPRVPALLCLWHVIKRVETHARVHSFKPVFDSETSRPRDPKQKDSTDHRNFCDAFLRLVQSRTEEEYGLRRRELYMLSSVEAAYIDDVWLDIWKRRIVRCWTDKVVHFGVQATSRVEGYHATLKSWLGTSKGDLLLIQSRLKHWWAGSIANYGADKANEEVRQLTRLPSPLFDAVNKVIHTYALKKTDDLRKQHLLAFRPCSGVYSRTMGMPCAHQLHAAEASGRGLSPYDFHPHWWIHRRHLPGPPQAVTLEPDTIQDRRCQRRRDRHVRGGGVRGTRRIPSAFENAMP